MFIVVNVVRCGLLILVIELVSIVSYLLSIMGGEFVCLFWWWYVSFYFCFDFEGCEVILLLILYFVWCINCGSGGY